MKTKNSSEVFANNAFIRTKKLFIVCIQYLSYVSNRVRENSFKCDFYERNNFDINTTLVVKRRMHQSISDAIERDSAPFFNIYILYAHLKTGLSLFREVFLNYL